MSFHLASQKAEATTPLPAATDDNCSSTSSSGLTAEAKGLIAVGSVLGVLHVALALFAIYKRRNKKPAAPAELGGVQTPPKEEGGLSVRPDTADRVPQPPPMGSSNGGDRPGSMFHGSSSAASLGTCKSPYKSTAASWGMH